MGSYEQIGSWQVSLAIPAKVRDLFREQTADLLSQQPSSWVRRFSNAARHSLLECLLVGGTMFIPPDPFHDPQFYLGNGGSCPTDRYDEARGFIEAQLAKLEGLRSEGLQREADYWGHVLSQIRGDEVITRIPLLVDPALGGEYAALIRVNYLTREARIEPPA